MTKLGTWLRRAAASAAMVLAITGVAATGAAADVSAGDAGVQHSGRVFFSGNGCQYVGWSDHRTAGTEIASGNCGNTIFVRAWVCTSGACLTTEWRSAPRRVTYTAPSGYTIRSSFHKACNSCTVHRIDH